MKVIDASSLTKYLLRELNWEEVEKRLIEGVCAPELIIKEVANAIWKHCVLFARISENLAIELLRALHRLVDGGVVRIVDQRIYLDSALCLAIAHKITLYDALYIAMAKSFGVLVTSDEKQARVAKVLGIEVEFIP